MIGAAFAIPILDSEPIPVVPKHLMPWILKDRREAMEGAMVKDTAGKVVHDGAGLEKARKSLRQVEAALAEKQSDAKVAEFLEEQLATARGKVEFYTGKIHLLDRVIAEGGV